VRFRLLAIALEITALACARGDRSGSAGYALQARGGTYHDGSGRAGLAVVATLRDERTGEGPALPWSATVRDGAGGVASGTYATAGRGSYAMWWWPEVALRDDAYVVTASDGAASAEASFAGATGPELPLPAPELAPDASRVDWPAVPGAASYACRVHGIDGTLQLEAVLTAPGCDLSPLPPGGYAASVLAFSADLPSVAASSDPTPALPPRFDVSEARLAFVRPDPGAPPLLATAAGGAIDFGSGTRGIAVWLSLRTADGTPPTSPWPVSVIGPSIPPESPLTFTYHANFPRQMVWSYEIPATPGTYWLAAGSSVVATFTLGVPAQLPFVVDAAASPRAPGSADVSWTAVEGAKAYLVSAWDHDLGTLVASMWTPPPPARFPNGSFVTGTAYDVVVAATDADMSGATVPSSFAVSEYPFLPASFVAE
jgi:hypothetical protein